MKRLGKWLLSIVKRESRPVITLPVIRYGNGVSAGEEAPGSEAVFMGDNIPYVFFHKDFFPFDNLSSSP